MAAGGVQVVGIGYGGSMTLTVQGNRIENRSSIKKS